MATGRQQFSLPSELPCDTDERSLSFGYFVWGADIKHLIKDFQQVIQVKPLEDDLFRSTKASTRFVVSYFIIHLGLLTWIDWKPILHMPLELLMDTLEQRHSRFYGDVFLDGPELDPQQICRCRAGVS